MNLYVTQKGQLRFIENSPVMELTGWTVRAGYDLATAPMLSGATAHGMTREAAMKLAKKAMGLMRYEAIL